MQRKFLLNLAMSCALLAAAHAQTPIPAPVPRAKAPNPQPTSSSGRETGTAAPSTTAVGLDQPVITLKGGCQPIGELQPAKDCVQSVTREQFEKLLTAMQPDMPADAKRAFALKYGRLLVFFDAAKALHVEDNPAVQQMLQYVTEQVMAEGVKRHYYEQFLHPSEEQIDAYYKKNSAKYVEADLDRIVIPRKPLAEDKAKSSETDDAAAAEKIRQQWTAGEDPSKLQQAAFEAAGVTGAGNPNVNLGARRPGSLPVSHEAVFRLKAGEVSPVYSDPAASFVYKVVSVRQIPLSEVKESIIKALQQQQLQDKLEEIGRSATPELNEQYFGAAPPGGPDPVARPAPGNPATSAPPK